ncbi:LytTR family DNA-binding domain-containing protein [Massilia sp. ST3]|uniref:LytR/AlgR family response regulator transcription factor n=1 Tax=Massilia sp. ST3 TaxID=2824903 RepID=UPI001B830239|nr:LytTR family DNA-binding domain-containing protein [Massilia sp. ST3]MBQ5948103.1 response regulator transcription factor [Massilia sp. ST3]
MPVRYLIVDDEARSRSNLRLALTDASDWELAAECASAAAAREALARHAADVVFLDIQMPGESGLVLARELAAQPAPPLVIFVTAYSEHAIDAFEVFALDYLLKPIGDARLAQAVERAAGMLAQRQRGAYAAALRDYAGAGTGSAEARRMEHVNVRSVGSIERIRFEDILWMQAASNYVELHLAARSVLHRITLNRMETLLPPGDYLRVHRSTIVRRDQIALLATDGDGSYRLTLRCGAVTAVSERYLAALKSAM